MAADAPYPAQTREPSRPWYGWIAFAGAMMILLGSFHVIAGLVAIFDEEYFLVGKSGLVVEVDYTAWGWAHLIIGLIVVFAGWGLFSGQTWARIVAVTLAMLSAVANLAFLSAYPIWSAIMIAVDILVIYAVLVHGDRRTLGAP
ncbi:MAG TPA: hypothetical protein VNQ53_09410 [Nocardioides sp.]|nr:hypothetical protein [Nocardioides sp.]